MNCAELRSALLDHALGEAAGAALGAHLQDCAACRAELARLRERAAALDAALAARVGDVPRGLEARILERAARRRRWPALTAAAALAAGLVLFAIVFRPARPPAAALAAWESPTRSLLKPPLPVAAGLPRVGETLFPMPQKSKI